MTRLPARTSASQRCEPRKPAPPVTTAVGIASMLPRPLEGCRGLHKGFTAETGASVRFRALVGTPGAARRDQDCDPARRLRRVALPGNAVVFAALPRRRARGRRHWLLRRDARVHGRVGADAAPAPRARRAPRGRGARRGDPPLAPPP